ncbi:MAG: hypothetical protein JXA41_07800 [Deltaproteobacteria bacterium]|nr:hypothetical protein [Deltaproteobacteria bacterium]
MTEDIIRCKKCILPSSYPGIKFDERGICNYCLETQDAKLPSYEELKSKLNNIIQSHSGKGKYDAIVGLSGGKDSSYVAYYLKKEYNLRILGINFDNSYRSDNAIKNLDILSDNLGIDLLTIRPSKTFLHKLFRHFLQKNGEFCSVCNNMGYLLIGSYCLNQQKLQGYAPLAVGGWSKKYEYQPGVSVTSMQYFFNHLTPALLDALISQPFIEEKVVHIFMQLNDPRQTKTYAESGKEFTNLISSFIQLPDYVPWDLNSMPQTLAENLGWVQPPNVHGSHFDCKLFPIKEFLKYKKYRLTQETIKNSVMIREGLMSRSYALKRMSLDQTEEPKFYKDFLQDLGLTTKDINENGEWSR